MSYIHCFFLILQCFEHDSWVLASYVIDSLPEIDRQISIFSPKLQQNLSESKRCSQIMQFRRPDLIQSLEERLLHTLSSEVIIYDFSIIIQRNKLLFEEIRKKLQSSGAVSHFYGFGMGCDSYDPCSCKPWKLLILELLSNIPRNQVAWWFDSSLGILANVSIW